MNCEECPVLKVDVQKGAGRGCHRREASSKDQASKARRRWSGQGWQHCPDSRRESDASRNGMNHAKATRGPLPQTRRTETAAFGARREVEGNHVSALVDRALGSVERMCSSGHMVVFDDDGSCVLNKMTGEERRRKWETTSWTCG